MARRRYLSTDISRDARINKLAMEAGDFAALLYTWLIPHVEDDARLKGTAEEVLLMVMPGRRDKEPADIEAALRAMHDIGLIVWTPDAEAVCFPESFYTYQTYITKARRTKAHDAAQPRETPSNAEQRRTTPHNAADQRTTPQNAASLKVSSSSSFSVRSSSPPPNPQPERPAPKLEPNGSGSTVLAGLIPDEIPGLTKAFRELDPELDAIWFRQTLDEAEFECDGGAAELSADDVREAVAEALEIVDLAFRNDSEKYPIRVPTRFAASKLVWAIESRLNDVRERRHRPPVPPPRRGAVVHHPIPRHQPIAGAPARSPSP